MATLQGPHQQKGFASHGREIIASHPGARNQPSQQALVTAMEACADCAQACATCADACLGEPNVAKLVTCIRLNQDCADVCTATSNLLSRQVSLDWDIAGAALEVCTIACDKCAQECAKHAAHMKHCQVCEAACRACLQACEFLLGQSAPVSA